MKNLNPKNEKRKIFPKKKFGQNFLNSEKYLKEIRDTLEIKQTDKIIEIGPGTGNLTEHLLAKGGQLIVVEKDKDLIPELRERFKEKELEIRNEDILEMTIPNYDYKLVGNLPYNIATEVIRKFMESQNPPKIMVFTIQWEVAQRICSSPPQMSRLGVFANIYGRPKIINKIPRGAFWPRPKVLSAIIKIEPNEKAKEYSKEFRELLEKTIKQGFKSPRKKILNNLSQDSSSKKEIEELLNQIKIEPSKRPAELTIKEWLTIARQR